MSERLVILHHAHHADEGVYRLVIAWEVTRPTHEDDESPPEVSYHDPRDIVWDADDERWRGRSPEDVARAQRQIVRDALREQARAARSRQARKARARTDLGTVGETL